jgi:hypothetical protein
VVKKCFTSHFDVFLAKIGLQFYVKQCQMGENPQKKATKTLSQHPPKIKNNNITQ